MNKDSKLLPQEREFDVKPKGVKYICEFCNKGEMKYYNPDSSMVTPTMIPHKCTSCEKIMYLPKMYPYIEWLPMEGTIILSLSGGNKMKKVMISQPMANKTEEVITEERNRVSKLLENKGYEVIDSFIDGDEYSNSSLEDRGVKNIPLFYLSKSIEFMSQCDAVFFCNDWDKYRGCRIEHEAATQYGLEILYDTPDNQ